MALLRRFSSAIKQIDKDCVRKLFEEELASKHQVDPSFEISTEEKSALLRYYVDNNLIAESQPIMLSYGETALFDKSNKSKSAPREQYTNLQVLGSSKSVSELILIKTALAVLSDNGIRDACVDINSIGDKDSTNRFAKELNSYYRKNISKMPSHCRQLFKKDTFSLLKCNKEECCRAYK